MTEPKLEWRKCDECSEPYTITAVLNPRRDLYSILPLSAAPPNVSGNFSLTEHEEEVRDAEGTNYGRRPVAVYGQGDYIPHNPSHFLDEVHADDLARHRKNNYNGLRLAMDES